MDDKENFEDSLRPEGSSRMEIKRERGLKREL